MQNVSPLRYPGGKASFARLIQGVVQSNNLSDCCLCEPFCGGAGASLSLLFSEIVDRIILNDLDRSIFSLWKSVLFDCDALCDAIATTPVTVREWRKQRAVYRDPGAEEEGALALATLYLNRCNRSGVIRNGGLIGGINQTGEWGIDARFNKADIQKRLRRIASYRDRIGLSQLDALDVIDLAEVSATSFGAAPVLLFVDPPYFRPGRNLYLDDLDEDYHCELAARLQSTCRAHWVLTYDDCDEVRDLYSRCRITEVPVRYTAHKKAVESELLITPRRLRVPWA